MKKIISILAVFLQVFALCFILCSCKEEKAQQSIYFLNFKPESASVYEELAKVYEEQTGVRVKVVTAAANTYEQTLKSEVAKSEPPTIFQVNGPIGYNSWKDYCADLTDSKIYSYLSDKSLAITSEGRVYAVPYVVEAYGIIYNDAIMKKYFAMPDRASSLSSAEEIKSFAELKTVVEDMTEKKKELGIDGVFASTSLLSGEDWRWQTHLANVPFYHEFKEMGDKDPVITATEIKNILFKYSENYKNIFDLYINNSLTPKTLLGSKSVNDSMSEFALGKCAMVQNGTWAWSQIADIKGNTVTAENIKMMPLYMGIDGEEKYGLCVGTESYITVNNKVSDEKKKLSLDFLDWLFSSNTGKNYVKEKLGFATPFNTFTGEELPGDPLAKEMTRYMNNKETISVPWVFVGFPSENFKTAFGDALLSYAQESGDFKKVVDTVINKWQSER